MNKLLAFFIISLLLQYCTTLPDDEESSGIVINGIVRDDCTRLPIKNITLRIWGQFSEGREINDSTLTDSIGGYTFNPIPNTYSTISLLQIAVNSTDLNSGIPIDSSYSTFFFEPSKTEDTDKDIDLSPRVQVELIVKPDTALSPAEFIKMTVFEKMPVSVTGTIETVYSVDSVNVFLGTNMIHRAVVIFIRDGKTKVVSKEFSVGCDGGFRIVLFY
jgi:hypothetical protein